MEERQIFQEVFDYFSTKYPAQQLHMRGLCVECRGEIIFNTDGYNLLFNLKRLTDAIKEELL